MSTKHIVVIGSNCFTGCHIVDGLLDDPATEVTGISRSDEYAPLFLPYKRHAPERFHFQKLDLVRENEQVLAVLDEIQPEVVINVAALSEVGLSNHRPLEYFDINTTAVVKLADHLRKTSYLKHYLHISSAEILGSCPGKLDETALFNPSTPYAVSKAAADMYLNTIAANFGFPVTLIRSTNVYGRHQQLFKIIPRTVIYLKQGRQIELHGGGTSAKSFIHVRDVVSGLLAAMERRATGTFHLSVPSDETIAQLVYRICETLGYDPLVCTKIVGERLGQDSRYLLDCGKAERELGWSPKVTMQSGIQETIDWIEANWREIQKLPLDYQHKV